MPEPDRSQRSGSLLDPGAPATVTYLFDDGHRREVVMSAVEADELRALGSDRTSPRDRAASRIRQYAKPAAKWLVIAIAGGVIGALISDHYADRQRELEIEATLVTAISRDAVKLFQDAQDASRAIDDPEQIVRRDRAADEWVRRSSEVAPVFQTYFAEKPVLEHWNQYQSAMYNWAVLGCCTTDAGRVRIVDLIHRYLDEHVGPSKRKAPTSEPWAALKARVDTATYQWVGFYLLRGRGALLRDLKESSPDLD